MSKGNKGFGALLTENLDDEPSAAERKVGESVLAGRSQALARLAAGKTVADRTELVDPERCRPWRLHNRDLDHLTEESCRDLIDSFLSAKKQRIPAIVRRLRDDPTHDFEIIAGVRRWWVVQWLREHHHPEYDYLITIQALNDEEAFRVSDLENRNRKDITDWERAQEYTKALAEFYNGSLAEMAEHVNLSKSWLSRMIDVARLPGSIVGAFADRHDITVRIARDLKPLSGEARALKAMTAEAENIRAERAAGRNVTPAQVAKRLVQTTQKSKTDRASRAGVTEVRSAAGKPLLSLTRASGRGGGVLITVHPRSGADKAEILRALEQLLPD